MRLIAADKLAIVFFLFGCSTSQAGTLQDFEKNATTTPAQHHSQHQQRHRQQSHSGDSDSFFSILFADMFDDVVSVMIDSSAQVLGSALYEGGSNSNDRIASGNETNDQRQLGEPITPYFRLNLNLQNISENIYGFDGKLELGRGALAGEYRQTSYRDKYQNEQLKLKQMQAFYRMTFANQFGINLGAGAASLNGVNHTQGAVISMPILFLPTRNIAFEFRPSWLFGENLSISEMDISALIAYQQMAIRVGYRELNSEGDALVGAYLGLDFIF